ncbi:MAG: FAD-binding oxidoreductase [Bacteroidetes bacterium]|nr:FAD-binding oxidoreductase [Bacteroidota bacterium]
MQLSYWEKNSFFTNIDVVIIGSGIVGLNAAFYLKKNKKKLNVLILERGLLPTGASSKNAGFACFGSPSELLSDLKNNSENEVFSLVEKRWKGLLRLRKNLGDKAIDFHNWGGYEVFDKSEKYDECASKIADLNKHTAKIIKKKEVYVSADKSIKAFGLKNVRHMLLNTAEGQIDTGKMIKALSTKVRELGIDIINGVNVKKIDDDGKNVVIHCNDELFLKAKKVIIATNGFAQQLLPNSPVQPARAQVLITEPIKNLKLKGTFHYDEGYYYFRNIGDRVLFGGGRNLDFKNEETTEFGLTTLIQNKLDELLKDMILPGVKYKVDMRWSGIMGVGPEKRSIVKATSKNVYCAVRMGGMGVAIGSLVGEEVAGMIDL